MSSLLYTSPSYDELYSSSPSDIKCKANELGICDDSFDKGTYKSAHYLTDQCPDDVHKLCMEELSGFKDGKYVALMRSPIREDNETPKIMWERIIDEIKQQLKIYEMSFPKPLTPDIPAVVVVSNGEPELISKSVFEVINRNEPPENLEYVVIIMQRIQPPRVNFNLSLFVDRMLELGIFWWDCKPSNTGCLEDNSEVMIDCDTSFMYILNEDQKRDANTILSCKIFMMLMYVINQLYVTISNNVDELAMFNHLRKQVIDIVSSPTLLANSITLISNLQLNFIARGRQHGPQDPIQTFVYYIMFFDNYLSGHKQFIDKTNQLLERQDIMVLYSLNIFSRSYLTDQNYINLIVDVLCDILNIKKQTPVDSRKRTKPPKHKTAKKTSNL